MEIKPGEQDPICLRTARWLRRLDIPELKLSCKSSKPGDDDHNLFSDDDCWNQSCLDLGYRIEGCLTASFPFRKEKAKMPLLLFSDQPPNLWLHWLIRNLRFVEWLKGWLGQVQFICSYINLIGSPPALIIIVMRGNEVPLRPWWGVVRWPWWQSWRCVPGKKGSRLDDVITSPVCR